MDKSKIVVTGARSNNLKNIDVEIPHKSLTVVTGLSGSGKSSLAFDTIYAEGQRRYIETFSAYARNFLGGMERPDVDKITGLSPVISIEQKTTNKNPRSTVGTTTEVYDYLRLLFARAGKAYSYLTGEPMVKYTEEKIIDMILSDYAGKKIFILTRLGTILSTDNDCKDFTAMDFNGTYFLYYEQTRFRAICASDNSIFIAGVLDDGMSVVYTSSAGNIWSERTLTYTENGQTLELEHQPLSMAYDSRMDRFVLGCTDGYIFYMPGCSHCNSIERKSTDDISALAFNSGCFIFR